MATIDKAATFGAPGRPGSPVEPKERYENFIGGHRVAPVKGGYGENRTPATGEPFTEVAAWKLAPALAARRNSSSAAITSAKKTFGDFPPSSATTCGSSRRRSSARCSR